MTMIQANKGQRFFKNSVKLSFRNVTEKQVQMLERTNPSVAMILSEKVRQTKDILSDVINLDCYRYDADFATSK